MPLDPSLVGRPLPPRTITVTEEHARAFASAVGETVAEVPPTFLTVVQIAAAIALGDDPELGLDFSRVLHGEEEHEWRRPLAVGDRLTAEPVVTRIVARGDAEFVTVASDVRDGAGEVVARARTILIVRGAA